MLNSLKYLCKSVSTLCVVAAVTTGSGTKAQNTFTLKDNAIESSKNLSIGGTFLGVDIYDPNLAFFVEGKLVYRLKKELGWIKANYALALGDRMDAITEASSMSDAVPVNGTQALRSFGGSIGYNFIKRIDVKLAKATFLSRAKSKKITIPLRKYRLYGVHAGYETFRSVLASGTSPSYTATIVENSLAGKEIVTSNVTPMLNAKIVSVGIHRQLIDHWNVQLSNGGNKTDYSSKTTSTVYADILFATSLVLDDILVPMNINAPNTNTLNPGSSRNPYNFYRADINGSVKKIPIGGRIGWEQIVLRSVGLMTGFEFGFRPGLIAPSENLYIMMKVGLMFNFKAK